MKENILWYCGSEKNSTKRSKFYNLDLFLYTSLISMGIYSCYNIVNELNGGKYMKLKTRIAIAFATIITVPIILSIIVVVGFGFYQIECIENTYGIEGTEYTNLTNPLEVLSALTVSTFDELESIIAEDPDLLKNAEVTEAINSELLEANSYLIVRAEGVVTYIGDDEKYASIKEIGLPAHSYEEETTSVGTYLTGEEVLIKQLNFNYSDGTIGTAFIVTDVSQSIPEIEEYLVTVAFAIVLILLMTGIVLVIWIQRGILRPLERMRIATQCIKEGNLDFEVKAETDDEMGQLCKDFEEMRLRLKRNEEEKFELDEEKKVLISNITHDLKTPITAIKGYAEGILDGVADTKEKQDKYLKTIYNKANELNILINELTVYSNVDRQRMPYNFQKLLVSEYFDDCAEDLEMELESKNIEFGYHNYVASEVEIIGDSEQIGRVIHNIINNSVKYMDKKKQIINLRIKDVGDFIQVEIEDNGKGIEAKDLPFIFDRFYRTDASRNSATGGSGIGLSIVKKIMEDHGGKIWATSKDGVGTVIYFVIRKSKGVSNE